MNRIASAGQIAAPGLFDRAIRRITGVWRDMAAGVAREDDDSIAAQMRACLAGRGGEVSARNRAAKLAQAYLALDEAGRPQLPAHAGRLRQRPRRGRGRLRERARRRQDPAERAAANAALRRALEPPRLRLLTQFTTIPDGMKFLVDLRADLLADAQRRRPHARRARERSARAAGQLVRRRLPRTARASTGTARRRCWRSSVGYEAVHEIRSWRDLKNRLDCDRRCYAFFHPRMPDRAADLRRGGAGARAWPAACSACSTRRPPVLRRRGRPTPRSSIRSATASSGLAGISFGNFLIKRVVEQLAAEFRNLKTFATLSPIPGFRRWLDARLDGRRRRRCCPRRRPAALRTPRRRRPAPETGAAGAGRHAAPAAAGCATRRCCKAVEPVLVAAVRALPADRERSGKRALDPVAHFHLSNGARVERINMLARHVRKGRQGERDADGQLPVRSRRRSRNTTRTMPARASATPPPAVRRLARGMGG